MITSRSRERKLLYDDLPILMQSESGKVILITEAIGERGVGMVVSSDGQPEIGHYSTEWLLSLYTEYTGTVLMENKDR